MQFYENCKPTVPKCSQVPDKGNVKNITPKLITIKLLKTSDNEEKLKNETERNKRITLDFLSETVQL